MWGGPQGGNMNQQNPAWGNNGPRGNQQMMGGYGGGNHHGYPGSQNWGGFR